MDSGQGTMRATSYLNVSMLSILCYFVGKTGTMLSDNTMENLKANGAGNFCVAKVSPDLPTTDFGPLSTPDNKCLIYPIHQPGK